MRISILKKADQWITRILSHPGIDEDTLAQNKIYWISSLAIIFMILCLTIAYHIIFPQLRILIFYGVFLIIIFLQGIIIPILFNQLPLLYKFINQTLVAIATFFVILKLGGITHSGGLIFVGFALVFFSLNYRKKSYSVGIFIIYMITVIIAGVLDPHLTVPAEMTPAVNISLFVINLLWISGFAMVFIMNFISQRVRLEQLKKDRIIELDEAKTRLYTNITHEFRTPLTIITGMTDLIRNDPERWTDEGNEKIRSNATVLLSLVNQMLDLSKLEAGVMPLKMIRADINLYIKHIVELFRSVATEKKIDLIFENGDQHPVIDYDPDKLMQIISNLLSNALKFTGLCGSVILTTSMTDDGKFEIRVSDNGTGIPETFLPFIFDRFFRVGEAHPGSGLGLALARELVKLMNGTITAESVYGEGTEMTVVLPVTYNSPLQDVPEFHEIGKKVSPHLIPGGKSVILPYDQDYTCEEKPLLLIVEDNSDVVQLLLAYLNNEYDVQIAANGLEGIKKATEFVPDIILSDIKMPVMDGIEMLKKIKNDFRTSHIPVVILTAKADFSSRLEGLEKGVDAYIAKPFVKEELLVQLRSLIELRKKLQERYVSGTHLFLTEDKDYHFEDAFMKRIQEIMTDNLDDEMFHINGLCKKMAMSRTQIYRKFRSLTDKTIAEYFRSLRLQKAKELLTDSGLTVTEAAYRTGFKNISHFSKVFSREFGINPREIRK